MSFFCWKQVTIISITLKLTLILFYVLCVTQFWALITAVVRPVMSSSLTKKKYKLETSRQELRHSRPWHSETPVKARLKILILHLNLICLYSVQMVRMNDWFFSSPMLDAVELKKSDLSSYPLCVVLGLTSESELRWSSRKATRKHTHRLKSSVAALLESLIGTC